MKINFIKSIMVLVTCTLLLSTVSGQSPNGMSYQAVIRNSNNALVTNTQIGMQISIIQGTVTGSVVYTESQNPTTNANGLVSIEIGGGPGFSTIDWANGPYFIKTETDPTGGTNYTITGTSQLLSVPYALHAKTAESVTGTISETDPLFTNSQAAFITTTDIANLNNLSGTNTGDQDLSSLATKTALADSTAQVRSEIPNVSGFLSSETDPIFSASVASGITSTDTINWNNKLDSYTETDPIFTSWNKSTGISITESQISDFGAYIQTETDPTFTSSQAAFITATDIANLNNLSGTNTGDQDLSSLATKTALADSTAQVRSEIPNVSGFLSSETDPIYSASVASGITSTDTINWNNKLDSYTETDPIFTSWNKSTGISITESQISDFGAYIQTETDPTFTSSQAAFITATDIANLNNLSGTNTGDQDLSSLATKTALADSTAQVRSEIPNVSGFLSSETDPIFSASVASGITSTDTINWNNKLDSYTETDPIFTSWNKSTGISITESQISDFGAYIQTETDPTFTSSQAAFITTTDIVNLSNLSGINTGDQDLSSLATKTALADSISQIRTEIPAAANGSETKLTAGSNVTITGSGTTANPYVVNAFVSMTQAARDALTVFEGMVIYNTTTHKPNYYNGTEWMNYDGTSAKTLAIGENHQGGIIAYIFQPGDPGYVDGETHGIIVATTDQSSGIEWITGGATQTTINSSSSSAFGSGRANTISMMNQAGFTGGAAKVCDDYSVTVNGVVYDDWFLPSSGEFLKICQLYTLGFGNLTYSQYWTSTQSSGNPAWNAIVIHVANPMAMQATKSQMRPVRAIRTF